MTAPPNEDKPRIASAGTTDSSTAPAADRSKTTSATTFIWSFVVSLLPSKSEWLNKGGEGRLKFVVLVVTIFGGIVSGIVWLVGPAFSVAEVPSPSEILIVDQHPTRVIIDRVEVSRLSDASEEYVVAWLKNVSDVTAINVEAEFMSAGGDALTVGENISNAWRLGRLSIPPGEELLVPIAPLSEYLRLAQNIYPHARLFEFSPPESLGGFTLRDRVCGLADSFGCDFASRSIPTAVTLEYGTVFGGTVEISTFFSGIFLLSEPSE